MQISSYTITAMAVHRPVVEFHKSSHKSGWYKMPDIKCRLTWVAWLERLTRLLLW